MFEIHDGKGTTKAEKRLKLEVYRGYSPSAGKKQIASFTRNDKMIRFVDSQAKNGEPAASDVRSRTLQQIPQFA
jgi:hypothetical protein